MKNSFSFTSESWKTIAKMAGLIFLGEGAIGVLTYIQGLTFTNSTIALLVSVSFPILISYISEWVSGLQVSETFKRFKHTFSK